MYFFVSFILCHSRDWEGVCRHHRQSFAFFFAFREKPYISWEKVKSSNEKTQGLPRTISDSFFSNVIFPTRALTVAYDERDHEHNDSDVMVKVVPYTNGDDVGFHHLVLLPQHVHSYFRRMTFATFHSCVVPSTKIMMLLTIQKYP